MGALEIPIDIGSVGDDELQRKLLALVRHSRRVESVLVAHIAEVDARRLYARHAASMYAYCTRILHLSEYEAYARIAVARASRRYPDLLEMLADGRLHLTGIAKLVPHLTDANREGLLASATHKTKNQIEELIAEMAPRADVSPAIRKVPDRTEPPRASAQLGLDRVNSNLQASGSAGDRQPSDPGPLPPEPRDAPRAPVAPPPRPAPPIATPLSPSRYKIQFTAGAELRAKLERLQMLLRRDLEASIDTAVTDKLARMDAKRFGLSRAPRKSLAETETAAHSRHLPAPVRRAVWQRDLGQCTFLLADGTRCPERRWLEFHHRDPFGKGGSHDPGNVCLMCRSHNAYLAEQDYGVAEMERHRRPPDRVSEGVA